MRQTLKRAVKGIIGSLLAVLIVAMVGQRVAEAWDDFSFPVLEGERFDVGDVALHMTCWGEGPVTIVFSSGMGNPATSWRPLARLLETDHKVCTYDRDGLGFSGDSARPRDAVLASERLSRLLSAAEIESPIVLVGHSYGALVGRVFASKYPEQVSALIMLDSSHEDMAERFPPFAQEGFRDLLDGFQMAPWLNAIALPRVFGLFAPAIDGLEGEDFDRSLALLNSIHHMSGTGEEAAGWERSAVAARGVHAQGFGSLPLDVFVAGDWPDEMMPSWLAMQKELAGLSTDSTFRVVEAANHPQIGMDARYTGEVAAVIRSRAASVATVP
jgi:pimeloyl-ACP methyl ester carboxylesterase